MKTFFVLKALLPLEKLVLQVLLQYFSFDSCSAETWQLIKQSFVTPAPAQCNAVTSQQEKNWGQYVMHCSCITCLPKIPLQAWWGPDEASRYVDGVNLKNGWMDKNTAGCTLRQVYSLYLRVMQALLVLSKQQTNKQTESWFFYSQQYFCLYRNSPFLQASLSLPLYFHVGFQGNTHHVLSINVGLLSNTQMTKKLWVGGVFVVWFCFLLVNESSYTFPNKY